MASEIKAVSVIGLGKLGAPIAVAIASRGFKVVGADMDPQKVAAVNAARAPAGEPMGEALRQAGGRLTAMTDTVAAVGDSDLTFVIVPTPSGPDFRFENRYVLAACADIGRGLAGKTAYHLVVVVSTVMPGSIGGPVLETLRSRGGRECGQNFGLCYSPTFVALGSVVDDFLNPDFILVGESDPQAGTALEAFYRKLCINDPSVVRINFENAELAKLALNCFITVKIAYVNFIAGLCERLIGGDIDAVTGMMGLDSRVSPKYLRGATAFGGPCFPRDNRALAALCRDLGVDDSLPSAVDFSNSERMRRLAESVGAFEGRVAVLGLAYKSGISATDESPGIDLVLRLQEMSVPVVVWDALAMDNASSELDSVERAQSAQACADAADIVVLMHPDASFRELGFREGQVVVDCWRVLDGVPAGVKYIRVGRADDG